MIGEKGKWGSIRIVKSERDSVVKAMENSLQVCACRRENCGSDPPGDMLPTKRTGMPMDSLLLLLVFSDSLINT